MVHTLCTYLRNRCLSQFLESKPCVRVVERLKQLEVHESTIGVRPTVVKQVHPRMRAWELFNRRGLLMAHTLKSLLDPNLVSKLLSDSVAKNLMYNEAMADVDRGHWEVGRERRGESLPHCKRKGRRKK